MDILARTTWTSLVGWLVGYWLLGTVASIDTFLASNSKLGHGLVAVFLGRRTSDRCYNSILSASQRPAASSQPAAINISLYIGCISVTSPFALG
jgi:hypothetical protein